METIEQFFERYGRALSEGDLAGIAACYMVPGLVLGSGASIPISDLAEVERAFADAAEQYRSQGLTRARAEVVTSYSLSSEVWLAEVNWEYLSTAGESLHQEHYHYLLRASPDEKLRIQVVIAHSPPR